MLQFGDAILHVGAQIVVTPDFFRRLGVSSDKNPKNVAGNVDQLAAHTVATFAHEFANHHEAAFCLPTQQLQAELPDRISLIKRFCAAQGPFQNYFEPAEWVTRFSGFVGDVTRVDPVLWRTGVSSAAILPG